MDLLLIYSNQLLLKRQSPHINYSKRWSHLLHIFDLIRRGFEVNDFNGNHLLCLSIESLKDLPECTATNTFDQFILQCKINE